MRRRSSSGGSSGALNSAPQSGNVAMLLSDASSEDWATIGVKVLSIALVPQGGGGNVTVYTAPTPAPVVNLVQLDQIAELLGNSTVPVGTYTAAVLTVSGNAGDILLTVAADPEAGFAAAPGTTIPSNQIQVQHTQGSGSNLTVPVKVTFDSPLVVSANQNNALDLEFDLAHPAFLVGHVPAGTGGSIWAVNFNGPVHHHPLHDLARLVLRHTYGNVSAISSDNGSITITKEFPVEPHVNPETAVAGAQSLQILADATNGTLFYDVDAKTKSVIMNFSSESGLGGQVRAHRGALSRGRHARRHAHLGQQPIQQRLVEPGRPRAARQCRQRCDLGRRRIGSPRCHDRRCQHGVLFPRAAKSRRRRGTDRHRARVPREQESGARLQSACERRRSAGDTAGRAEHRHRDRRIRRRHLGADDLAGFTYTRNFRMPSDDYVYTLDYIGAASANGTDDTGTAIVGYKWWNFAYPTLLTSGTDAVSEFIAATNGSVDFGGTVGAVPSRGVSFATWNDPANSAVGGRRRRAFCSPRFCRSATSPPVW